MSSKYLDLLVGEVEYKQCYNAACKTIFLQARRHWFRSEDAEGEENRTRVHSGPDKKNLELDTRFIFYF